MKHGCYSSRLSSLPVRLLGVAFVIALAACDGEGGGASSSSNGADGADGASGAAGANGANGGNGAAGTNGANGANGANGSTSLAGITAEPAGANCAYGGSRITAGGDTNGDGVLSPSEVTSTQYICKSAPGGLPWVDVTAASVHAAPNTGYIADSALAQVEVLLPANPAVGDVVRVAGAGAGGFKIAQNAGQTIAARGLGLEAGAIWTPRMPTGKWRTVSCSQDGSLLVAGQNPSAGNGPLYVSRDRGHTWSATSLLGWFVSSAVSADGQKIAVTDNAYVNLSVDGGVTWTHATPSGQWWSIAGSADFGKLVAAKNPGDLYTSNDGALWFDRGYSHAWVSIASSADAAKLVAASDGDALLTSSDSGATWTSHEQGKAWSAVASSVDGTKLAAAVSGGQLYTSTDSGVTWAAHESNRAWTTLASSADGRRLVAGTWNSLLFTSTDGGATWVARGTSARWASLAGSADGSVLIAAASDGALFTSEDHIEGAELRTGFGTGGTVIGEAHEAIELQYVGGGVFNVISSTGFFELR